MGLKQLLCVAIVVISQCPSCYRFEAASLANVEPLQEQFIFALKELSKQCVETQALKRFQTLPKNCYDILKSGNTVSGVHVIRPNDSPAAFAVSCNMDVMGGGWTYLLNRYDGSQNFYLNWKDYKRGFGDLKGEFWLGLDQLHHLAGSEDNELLVEVVDWDNKKAYAVYEQFRIGSESESYPIKVLSGFSGDAGDSLTYTVGFKFSTYDRDNDNHTANCASTYHGAWWYTSCHRGQLTGTHFNYNTDNTKGMNWHTYHTYFSLKEARMMVRRREK